MLARIEYKLTPLERARTELNVASVIFTKTIGNIEEDVHTSRRLEVAALEYARQALIETGETGTAVADLLLLQLQDLTEQ